MDAHQSMLQVTSVTCSVFLFRLSRMPLLFRFSPLNYSRILDNSSQSPMFRSLHPPTLTVLFPHHPILQMRKFVTRQRTICYTCGRQQRGACPQPALMNDKMMTDD